MENLLLVETKYTPEIEGDVKRNFLNISGSSYPENSNKFYKPVFEWIEEYFKNQNELTVNFYINYFNTSSSKCFMILIEMLEEYQNKGCKILANWHYKKDDEDILESGEELFMGMDVDHKFIKID